MNFNWQFLQPDLEEVAKLKVIGLIVIAKGNNLDFGTQINESASEFPKQTH
jgi:hypothetical protein